MFIYVRILGNSFHLLLATCYMSTRQSLSRSEEFELSYLEWHQGKEPLMLLHGLADSAWVWASLGDYGR